MKRCYFTNSHSEAQDQPCKNALDDRSHKKMRGPPSPVMKTPESSASVVIPNANGREETLIRQEFKDFPHKRRTRQEQQKKEEHHLDFTLSNPKLLLAEFHEIEHESNDNDMLLGHARHRNDNQDNEEDEELKLIMAASCLPPFRPRTISNVSGCPISPASSLDGLC